MCKKLRGAMEKIREGEIGHAERKQLHVFIM
jgi:hypothetical protein